MLCFLLRAFILVGVFLQLYARDLTLEAGHMKPFGFGRPNKPIEEVVNFPSARSFFRKYVHPKKPVKMKGAAKYSEAYYNWNDDYFLTLDRIGDTEISVETIKKESRKQDVKNMRFRDFVNDYNTSGIYMVDGVPDGLRKDVVFPCVLQCDAIYENLLVDNVMWFSSGGTKSVVHTDSVENINCLFRGEKELVMVDPSIHGDKVDLDHPEGSYSGVDVDAVDYTKYPGLADVEFYHVLLQAGDCLYIPYKWIHQVRSYESNLAINFWWKTQDLEEEELARCKHPCDLDFTMDKVNFKGFSELMSDSNEVRSHLISAMGSEKEFDFTAFMTLFLGDEGDLILYSKDREKGAKLALMKQLFLMFSLLDDNTDNTVTLQEVVNVSESVMGDFINYLDSVEELVDSALLEAQADATDDGGQESQKVKEEL